MRAPHPELWKNDVMHALHYARHVLHVKCKAIKRNIQRKYKKDIAGTHLSWSWRVTRSIVPAGMWSGSSQGTAMCTCRQQSEFGSDRAAAHDMQADP